MKSRYIKTQRNRLPRHRQSKRLYGSFEDANRWIKCHWCGFIVDLMRDVTSTDGSGNYTTDACSISELPVGYTSEGFQLNICTIDTVRFGIGVMIENDIEGNPITDYYTPRIPLVSVGCPMCGTRNLP